MDAESSRTVVVVAGGDPLGPDVLDGVPADALVVAADSGVDRALAIGLRVDVAIGDFDSVSVAGLEAATAQGAAVDRHPEAKDAIDLELALDEAARLGAERVVVVGGGGGRLDHHLANLLLLAHDKYARLDVEARMSAARVHVVRDRAEIVGRADGLVSLLPVHGAARGVRTEGLLYPLSGDSLPAGTSRGVSNRFVGDRAVVTIDEGVLLCVVAD
jgi:thiamine pyrophosphokinase